MRWQAIVISVIAACLVAQSSMKPSEVESFKSRIGWSVMPPPNLSGGVRADWPSLLAALQPSLGGLKQYSESVYSDEPGLVQLHVTWRRGEKRLAVAVYVSGTDAMQVREKLIFIASDTMRMTIPYVRGPMDLGEISVRCLAGQDDTLMWAFHNVLVKVENDDTGFDIVPASYAIQALMNQALTPVLAAAGPQVDGIQVSPAPSHVGDEVRVSVSPASGTTPNLSARFFESPGESLGVKGSDTLSSTYLAKSPGQTRIDVTLFDKKTLLSSAFVVPVVVLPQAAQSCMDPGVVEAFKSRIGWNAMPPPDLSGGVCADWSSLATALQPTVGGLRKYSQSAIFVEPGLMHLQITWRRGQQGLGVETYVSVTPASGSTPELTVRFREPLPKLLDLNGADGVSATFVAKQPGQTRIDVTLVDKKTLLPPVHCVPLEVLP